MLNDTMYYVYRLPEKLADGFCFGDGNPITFTNVDWFNGFNGVTDDRIRDEIKNKNYYQEGYSFLVLAPSIDFSIIIG